MSKRVSGMYRLLVHLGSVLKIPMEHLLKNIQHNTDFFSEPSPTETEITVSDIRLPALPPGLIFSVRLFCIGGYNLAARH